MSITAVSASAPIGSHQRSALAVLRWWSLMAVVVVGAAVPWYTLRLLPGLTVGAAKVNVLDVLVGCAVLSTLPSIVRETLRRNAAVLSVWAFLLAMVVPLTVGLRDHDSAFFAIREARALAFYALALVCATAGYGAKDFRALAYGYTIGAVIAAAAVFAHLRWGVPVPGYPETPLKVPGWAPFNAVGLYLQWTTPAIAFMLGVVAFRTATTRVAQAVWAAALFVIAWYVLAAAERFAQGVTVLAAAAGIAVPVGKRGRLGRPASVAVILVIASAFVVGAATGASWVSTWARYAALRWSVVLTDRSLVYRVREFIAGLGLFARNPLIGGGLGKAVAIAPPAGVVVPWHYLSTGYGFLLVRTGLLGFTLYLWMIGTAVAWGWRSLRAGVDGQSWPSRAVGLAGIGLILVANLLYPAVDIPEAAIAFSLFFGMLVSRGRHQQDL